MGRDIEVTDGEKDHVGKGVEVAESTGSILDDFDDSVEAFGDGILAFSRALRVRVCWRERVEE